MKLYLLKFDLKSREILFLAGFGNLKPQCDASTTLPKNSVWAVDAASLMLLSTSVLPLPIPRCSRLARFLMPSSSSHGGSNSKTLAFGGCTP